LVFAGLQTMLLTSKAQQTISSLSMITFPYDYFGPEVLFKPCVAEKFVDDDDDDNFILTEVVTSRNLTSTSRKLTSIESCVEHT